MNSSLLAKWMVRDKYNNIANMTGYGRPIGVVIADCEIIPIKHTRRLYDSLSGTERIWELMGE